MTGQPIYIVGSHSTGKTTLARYIATEYGIPLLPEIAREVLHEMDVQSIDVLRRDPVLVDDFQSRIFKRQQDVESAAGTGSWVTDRSVDCIVYALAHSPAARRFINRADLEPWFESLSDGIVFFTRPDPGLVSNDGVRETPTWEGIIRVDASIQTLLSLYDINYISITGTSAADRMSTVRGVLDV